MDGVAVQDMGAFELGSDRSPIANAGPPLTVECLSPAGATVTLDGSASSDPDQAREPERPPRLSSGEPPPPPLFELVPSDPNR